MSLRDQLQAIYERHGQLTPTLVVEEARDANHPLHERFEWDDAVASEAWRKGQAHELIRSVRVVYQQPTDTLPEKSVRAYQAVRSDDGYVYEPSETVVQNEFQSKLVLADMRREWMALKRRYDDFEEFWQLVRADIADAA